MSQSQQSNPSLADAMNALNLGNANEVPRMRDMRFERRHSPWRTPGCQNSDAHLRALKDTFPHRKWMPELYELQDIAFQRAKDLGKDFIKLIGADDQTYADTSIGLPLQWNFLEILSKREDILDSNHYDLPASIYQHIKVRVLFQHMSLLDIQTELARQNINIHWLAMLNIGIDMIKEAEDWHELDTRHNGPSRTTKVQCSSSDLQD
ncbi:hypothetical protein LTR66_014246 [Elasticomyces elasticus]|nr:hypothetical protein LTR66_014246 [Elasticomyces elasticus]